MHETYTLGSPCPENSITALSYHKPRRTISTSKDVQQSNPLTYEEAISATGFGKFNIILLILTIPSAIASICATTAMSFILSEAQCDLSLTLDDKGMLNAITYIGMITSAFIWGMIGDSYGRRTVLLYAYGADCAIMTLGTFAQAKWVLLVAKYFSGFMMNGPISVLMCYVSEFHATSFRPKLITILGVNYSVARTFLPLLAWAIMPLKLHFTIIDGYIDYKSWQVFLLITCIPSLLAWWGHYYLPETPKFLMTKGRFDEAIEIFKKIYSTNTGNPPETLPFSELIDDTYEEKFEVNETNHKNVFSPIVNIIENLRPLFSMEYLFKTFLMCSIMFGGLLGGNTLRLWLPQLFTTMDEYVQTHGYTGATLCQMLDYGSKITNVTQETVSECVVPDVNDEVYINNTIVPVCAIIGYFIIAALVKPLGKKFLLVTQYFLSGWLVIGNYWSTNSLTTVILSSLYLTFFSICATTATATAVEIYPTNMRTMASSLFLLCGRAGSVLGNTLFPVLLYSGCLPPFIFIGGFMFLCAIFSFMLPSTENKPLK